MGVMVANYRLYYDAVSYKHLTLQTTYHVESYGVAGHIKKKQKDNHHNLLVPDHSRNQSI